MKKQERVIPKKNYFYLIIMLISVAFFTFLVFEINDNIQERKLEVSNYNEFISEVKLEEIDSVLTEPSSDLFILITRVNDENVYELESNIKKIIKNYDMRENFIYIDFSNGSIEELNRKFKTSIKSIPAVIYYRNGELSKFKDSSNNMLQASDIEQIIEEYEIN